MKNMHVSIYCPHCKRYTSLTPATTDFEYGTKRFRVECVWKATPNEKWWIGICNSCKNPVLVLNEGNLVFPHPLPTPSDKRIPEKIRMDLDEAKLCFGVRAYRACAVMARRAMQSSCIEKNASQNRLVDQLQELVENGIITKKLKKLADVVRWVGNDAAHPGSEEVTREDAEDVLTLCEQFLHIVYVTNSIADERLRKRKKK